MTDDSTPTGQLGTEYDRVVAGHVVHVLDYGDWQAIYRPRGRPSDWLGDVHQAKVLRGAPWVAWAQATKSETFCDSWDEAIATLLGAR